MYDQLTSDPALTQGAIVDDCPLARLDDPALGLGAMSEPFVGKARVVVLTQACDLANTDKLSKALVAVVREARLLVEQGILKAPAVRDSIRRHQEFGWYFLPASTSPVTFPESIVDLRELHTVHRGILDRLIAEGRGVCRLTTPYREHLAQHFGVTYMRIGLPEPYTTEP